MEARGLLGTGRENQVVSDIRATTFYPLHP
jgi:hypothetical protein